MKKLTALLFLFAVISGNAQTNPNSILKKSKHDPLLQKGWYISFNPLSVLEPNRGAVGLGIGNRISKRFEIWGEWSYLYKGFKVEQGRYDNLKGFRTTAGLRYYYNLKRGFFAGLEFRIKKYSFDDKDDFINAQTNDTLSDYAYKAFHTLIGGNTIWGKRFSLSKNNKLEVELNAGFGAEQRYVKKENVPAGYEKMPVVDHTEYGFLHKNYINEVTLPYLVGAIMFIYHL